MQKQEIQVGMVVSFGRAHGEHTVGKVVKVNREKVKVQQLQDRGVLRSYPVGTIWSVPASLLSPADPTPVKAVLDVPLPRGVERFIEGDEPMVDTVPASVKVASTPTPEAPVSASPTKTPKASAKAKARISGKGYGESEPKADCRENCTEEEHAQNRRSEFLIIKK